MLELVINNQELGPKTLLAPTQISIARQKYSITCFLNGIFIGYSRFDVGLFVICGWFNQPKARGGQKCLAFLASAWKARGYHFFPPPWDILLFLHEINGTFRF